LSHNLDKEDIAELYCRSSLQRKVLTEDVSERKGNGKRFSKDHNQLKKKKMSALASAASII